MSRALLSIVSVCLVFFSAALAEARVLRVPADHPTIQAAIDAASEGDRIRVSRGRYCGATVTKRVSLEGKGWPRIIGCDASPTITGGARAGFFLPGTGGVNAASGSSIRGFVFDGRGISNSNLAPLAFGVFARFASDVTVRGNRFWGTVQAITNTAGDRWRIEHNRISDLTVFDCTGLCTGGDGIVIALSIGAHSAPGGAAAALNRPEHNLVRHNRISGMAPDAFASFSLAGVLLLAADSTVVLHNQLALRDNPAAAAVGQGILVTNTCCGLAGGFIPGARYNVLGYNDGRRSETGIVVEGTGGINTLGLLLYRNLGTTVVEGSEIVAFARSSVAPALAQPTL